MRTPYRRLRQLGLSEWASIATIVSVPIAIIAIVVPLLVRDPPRDTAGDGATPTLATPSAAPDRVCDSQPAATPDRTLLADGGTNVSRCFRADSPWHLEATGTDGQQCDLSVLDQRETRLQGSAGVTFQVQERASGQFELHHAQHCRVVFRTGTGPARRLPLRVDPTARGGATPVFRSVDGFVVRPAAGCRVVVFRSSDGRPVRSVGAGAPTEVLGAGLFWIETEQRGCSLAVDAA